MSIWQQLRASLLRTAQLVLALSLVTNLAMLALPLYSLQIFDRVLTSSSMETLWMLLVGVAIFGMTGICFEHLRRNALCELSFYLEEKIFPVLVERMNISNFNSNKQKLLEEYNFTQKQIQSASALVFIDALMMPLFVVITYLIHPALGIFTLSVNALLVLMVFIKYKWQLPKQFSNQSQRSSSQSTMLSNSSALAWLNMTANYSSWHEQKQLDWQTQLIASKLNELPVSIVANLNQCIRWLAQAGLPTVGAILLLSNQITTGGFIAGLIIGGKTFMPVEAMIANLDGFKKIKLFFMNIKQVLESDFIELGAYKANVKGCIMIENLDLGDIQKSLNRSNSRFNLSANPGDTIAIVGSAGSGQDAIIRQLMAYEPVETGVITIDGIRLEDWNKQKLLQSIGFVSGSIKLPETTIISIITSFGCISNTAAIRAAERTGLNSKLIELNMSYDDIFNSINSSLNQTLRQLIVLTSALARNPQILILENP